MLNYIIVGLIGFWIGFLVMGVFSVRAYNKGFADAKREIVARLKRQMRDNGAFKGGDDH